MDSGHEAREECGQFLVPWCSHHVELVMGLSHYYFSKEGISASLPPYMVMGL